MTNRTLQVLIVKGQIGYVHLVFVPQILGEPLNSNSLYLINERQEIILFLGDCVAQPHSILDPERAAALTELKALCDRYNVELLFLSQTSEELIKCAERVSPPPKN